MIYPLNKKRRSRSVGRRLVAGLLGLLLLFSLFSWLAKWTGAGWAVAISRPAWFFSSRLGQGWQASWALFASREKLIAERVSLLARVAELERQALGQELLLAENAELRAAAGLAPNTPRQIVAAVISGPERNSFDTFLLDLGSADEAGARLAVGDLVSLDNGLALGRLIAVEAEVSKVKLFSAPDNELPVALGETSLPVKLIGRGLGNFMVEVPRSLLVNVGDRAFFNDRSLNWLVAEVGSVDKDNSETMQRVLLRLPFNLNQLSYVQIHQR